MSQIGSESNDLHCIFANKENWGKYLGHLFITSSSAHFLNKTDLEMNCNYSLFTKLL